MRRVLSIGLLMLITTTAEADTINLYAAGSLRAALTEVARAFQADSGGQHQVETTFGASGLLRECIEAGAAVHVFAAADKGHPKRLAEQGLAATPSLSPHATSRARSCGRVLRSAPRPCSTFCSVPRCASAPPRPRRILQVTTPLPCSPRPRRSRQVPKQCWKAKRCSARGGPASPTAPEGHSPYAWLLSSDQPDLFLTYCTNALQAKAERPELSSVGIGKTLNVAADYGLIALRNAPAAAEDLVKYILANKAQAILLRHAFGPGTPPQ